MVIDEDDHLHIAYSKWSMTYNDAIAALYQTNATGSWTKAVIDDAGLIGNDIDLVLVGDELHAVYDGYSTLWHAQFPKGYVED